MKKGAINNLGFTIIEVVLVLGIAGLIFMMMFLALPALQRNSRDARRRDDMFTFEDAVKKFQTNNRGAFPTTPDSGSVTTSAAGNASAAANSWAGFYRDFLPNPFKDPGGDDYKIVAAKCAPSASTGKCTGTAATLLSGIPTNTNHSIFIIIQATCQDESAVGSSNLRKAVVLYKLEGGGVYCGDI